MSRSSMTANQRTYQALLDAHKKREKTEYERMSAAAKRVHWEEALWAQIRRKRSLPPIVRQYRWHPSRAYSADFCAPAIALIIEVDGGLWSGGNGGSHNSAWGYERDRKRDCEAIKQGWTVLRFTPSMIEDRSAIGYLVDICATRWLDQQAS